VSDRLTPGGFVPGPFEHDAPSAVGVIDLDSSLHPRTPDGEPFGEPETDALVLVRLHGDPLGTIHLHRAASIEGNRLPASLRGPIAAHRARHGCAPGSTGCPGNLPREPVEPAGVIVCTAGRPAQLGCCLRSLLRDQRDFELLVVDNRPSEPATRRVVSELARDDARLRYVAETRPGLSAARNRGLAESTAELVAFTDDDVIVEPCWLSWLLDAFAEPGVLISCGLVLPLELQTPAQKRFERYDGFSKGFVRREFHAATGQARGRLLYPFINGVIGTGNSMAFRRRELLALGGFDPALGAGTRARAGEETCAFAALLLSGGRAVYQPRALCWHEHRRDEQALRSQVQAYGISVGAIIARAVRTEPRLLRTAMAALPIALGLSAAPSDPRMGPASGLRPTELDRLRRRAMLVGPLRYAQALREARAHEQRHSQAERAEQPGDRIGSSQGV